jgi:hypothetical protein
LRSLKERFLHFTDYANGLFQAQNRSIHLFLGFPRSLSLSFSWFTLNWLLCILSESSVILFHWPERLYFSCLYSV